MPSAKPVLSRMRSTKKFIRSNSQPQMGLMMRRARLGMTPTSRAIWAGVSDCPFRSGRVLGSLGIRYARADHQIGKTHDHPHHQRAAEQGVVPDEAQRPEGMRATRGRQGFRGQPGQTKAASPKASAKPRSRPRYHSRCADNARPASSLNAAAVAMRIMNVREKSLPRSRSG